MNSGLCPGGLKDEGSKSSGKIEEQEARESRA
jgi:hypothetical protein